jgi:hypothetical protein
VGLKGLIQLGAPVEKLTTEIRRVVVQQVPYALSRALNGVAVMAQQKMIQRIPQQFKIKTTWHDRGRYGIKVQRSSKRFLQAAVYTLAPWLKDHETGAIRQAAKGRHLAIPTRFVPRTARGLIQGRAKPRRLQRFSKDERAQVIRGSTTKRKGKVSLMFLIRRRVQIKPRLEFQKTVSEEFQREFKSLFAQEFKKALHTIR